MNFLLITQSQPIHHISFDINLLGYSDDVVTELCRRAGWDLRHEKVVEHQKFDVVEAEANHWTHLVKKRPPISSSLIPGVMK